MIRNLSASDVNPQQSEPSKTSLLNLHHLVVHNTTIEDDKNEYTEQEDFFPAIDNINENDTNEVPPAVESDETVKSICPLKICDTASNMMLKGSKTSKDSIIARPTSVEDKPLPNSQEKDVPLQNELSLPIIELKRPPTPVEAWDNISQVIIINTASDPQKSTHKDKNEVESPAVGDTKAVNQSTKFRHSTCFKENKSLKSRLPRLTKGKPRLKNLTTERNEKRMSGSPSYAPKAYSPSQQVHVQQNQYRKNSSPPRSNASAMSSRTLSPLCGPLSSSRSKTPSSCVTPIYRSNKEKETELQNMLEEMCSVLDHMKDRIDEDEVKIQDHLNLSEKEKEKSNLLKVNYIMPAKDGAGETNLRSMENPDEEAIYVKGNSDCDPLSKKTNFLHCLSELNGQNQLNLKELHNIVKEVIIKSGDKGLSKQIELQFYNVEQLQTDLVQKLVRTITKFYDKNENLLVENNNYRVRQETIIPEIEQKQVMLEMENQSLLEKLKLTIQNLEDERIINQKKKLTGQAIAQTKSKIQKAEGKLQQLDSKVNELNTLIKKHEALIKQKETMMDQHIKKIKFLETNVNELELENRNLREQIENIRANDEERLNNFLQDSQELKDAKEQLISLKEHLNEEIDGREKTSAQLFETSTRLKSMEDKCKNLSLLVESAKKEVKLKQIECVEKESKLQEEIEQLHTELNARKVMLKVAENEVKLTKTKLNKAELIYRQELKKEKETSSVEEQLRLDLTVRDEQITQLQEQIKSLVEKKFNNREPLKTKNKMNKLSEKQSATSFNRVALTAQVVDLERTIAALTKDNLQLNQLLGRKNLELNQRDRIVKMQTEVLKIRDELIVLIKSKEAKHEEDIKRLNNIIQEREQAIAKEWNKALKQDRQLDETKSWQNIDTSLIQETTLNPTEESMYMSGTIYELFSVLEKKEMELETMQQRVQQLEGLQETYNQQRTRQEARISKLEMALSEKCHDTSGLVPIVAQ